MLDAEGRFWDHGELVTHRGMMDAFASWIRRHPRDGRYVLCNGYDWTYFSVRDVPFFVRALGGSPALPTLVLSDRSQEPFDPRWLSVGDGGALYTRVKGGEHEARFTPAAQLALAPLLVEGPSGEPGFRVAGSDEVVTPPARRRGDPDEAGGSARSSA